MYAPQNNSPHTTIATTINAADTTITVENGSVLPDAENILAIGLGEDAEMVKLTAKTGNVLTVERGFDGTTPKQWIAGDWIYRPIAAYDIRSLQENVNTDRVHVYGVRWDMQNPSSELQRTGDAVGIGEPVPAVGALGGSSPFDQLEPWKSIRECNVKNGAIVAYKGDAGFTRDGTNGDVMVYFPAIYLRTYIEGGRYYNIEIADGAKDGFAKIAGRNSFCLGKYKTVLDGTTHVSKTGVAPCVSITRAAFRTAARAKGAKWAQQDAAARFALAILYLVEFADFNSQAKIGRGFVDGNSAAALTGGTDALVYHTGMEQNAGGNGKAQIVYRGVESPWGNVWEFIDGININNGKPYICTNPANFADDTTANYAAASFTCAAASGWQKTLARDGNIPWLLLPSAVGGSETSFIADHYWYAAGWRLALAGGHWNNGSTAGLLAWLAYNDSTIASAAVGSRLLYLP